MLPKQYRLPSFIIPQLVKKGKRVQGTVATLIFQQLETSNKQSACAIIVTTHLSKKATARNRTKRLLVETIHKHIEVMKPGFQIIVMARKILEKEKLQDVLPEMTDLLRKAKLIE